MNILHVGSCEVGEIRNSADAVGYPCSRTSSTQCSDCGSELCESHAETCGGCHAIFCPSCFFLSSSAALEARARGTSRAKKSLEPVTNLCPFRIEEQLQRTHELGLKSGPHIQFDGRPYCPQVLLPRKCTKNAQPSVLCFAKYLWH